MFLKIRFDGAVGFGAGNIDPDVRHVWVDCMAAVSFRGIPRGEGCFMRLPCGLEYRVPYEASHMVRWFCEERAAHMATLRGE